MRLYIFRPFALFAILCSIIMLFSCNDQSKEEAFLSSLDKTILQSTQSSLYKMKDDIELLLEKTYEPCSREKARLWIPVARTVERFTMNLSVYILNLKKEIKTKDISSSVLYDSLNHRIHIYRDSTYASHEMIKHYFPDRFDGIDTPQTKQADLITQLQLLKTATHLQAPLLLTQIDHSIMQTGTSMVSFCRENVSCIIDRFDTYSAIIGQSSNVLLPGQTLEITAGIGAFSKTASPKITINGKLCQLQGDGVVRFPLIASGNAGKYKVPVKIDYVDENGIQQTISRDIVYEVLIKNKEIPTHLSH